MHHIPWYIAERESLCTHSANIMLLKELDGELNSWSPAHEARALALRYTGPVHKILTHPLPTLIRITIKKKFPLYWKKKSSSDHTVWPQPIWKKIKDFMTNTTAASKYIPRRPRISINWNPPVSDPNLLSKFQKNVIFRKFLKFFIFWNLLSKFGSERGDFNWCWLWAS